ncbi:bacteriocin maturation protein [Paenibacillus macerans]|uniref:bacteriocin maturation protein n=1 Tax=Paenibacillus macerans TaxID=44252 RepID=UPI003D27B8CC
MSPHRLQTVRPDDILAVGSGPVFFSLLSALTRSGFTDFHLCMIGSASADRKPLAEWLRGARQAAPEARLREAVLGQKDAAGWRKFVRPHQKILYASQEGDPGELLLLEQACREENKALLPAVCLHRTGVAGPFVQPGLEGGWESAWRRLHEPALCRGLQRQPVSVAAGELLANALVSRLLRYIAGEGEEGEGNLVYLLDLETLEGGWHAFFPHPFAHGRKGIPTENLQISWRRLEQISDHWFEQSPERRIKQSPEQWIKQSPERWIKQSPEQRIKQTSDHPSDQTSDQPFKQITKCGIEPTFEGSLPAGWFSYFGRLTSGQIGIFHAWEEGGLSQLPLAQCRVQAADPLSEGPASLLPDLVCAGLTHEEARREAGLAGIEAYVSRLAEALLDETGGVVGIGAGETAEEALRRGVEAYLCETLRMRICGQTREQADEREHEGTREQVHKQSQELVPSAACVRLGNVEDKHCRYYLQVLNIMRGEPVIGLGEAVSGFPVFWAGTGGAWYGGVGLNHTFALRNALRAALMMAQNTQDPPGSGCRPANVLEIPSVQLKQNASVLIDIDSINETFQPEVLSDVLQVVRKKGYHLNVVDLAVEPFLKELAVFGVSLRVGGTS